MLTSKALSWIGRIGGLAVLGAAGVSVAATGPALYSAAQADRGAQVYAERCAMCHGASLEGGAGPALKGTGFRQMAQVQALTAASLLDVVSQTMPQSAPASLPPDQYAAVVAYVLQQNGQPAGAAELSAQTAGLATVHLGDD